MRDAKKTDLSGTPALAVTAEALYVDPRSGDRKVVQIPNEPLQHYNRYYDSHRDAGHIYCLHCTAQMRFVENGPSSSGSSGAGSPAYFKPVRKHDDDCVVPLRPADNRKTPIDRTKGYQLNINTAEFSEVFNQRSGVYQVGRKGNIEKLLDEDFRDRETFVIRDVKDLICFISKADNNRIRDSRVVFQNNAENWDEFFIRAGTPSRLQNLVRRLENRRKGTEPLFAALEITTTAYHNPQPAMKTNERGKIYYAVPRAPVNAVEIGRDERGKRAFARIDIYIDERNNTRIRDSLLSPDTYLVMGEVRHKKLEHENSTTHYLSLTVTDARQVCPVNIENIHKTKLQHAGISLKKIAPPEPNRS